MKTLDYIIKKFNPQFTKSYTNIPGSRHKELLTMFRDLQFTKGAEIGVAAGIYSEKICKANPQLRLYCIDAWKAYPEYRDYISQSILDGFYNETVNRLKPYNCKIIRGFSEKVYKKFPDGSLDFVYIDGNHDFLHVTQDIAYWSPKVKKDGIVAGDDFIRSAGKNGLFNNVKDVVPAYAYANRINPWFVLRKPRETSSWFWIKT